MTRDDDGATVTAAAAAGTTAAEVAAQFRDRYGQTGKCAACGRGGPRVVRPLAAGEATSGAALGERERLVDIVHTDVLDVATVESAGYQGGQKVTVRTCPPNPTSRPEWKRPLDSALPVTVEFHRRSVALGVFERSEERL